MQTLLDQLYANESGLCWCQLPFDLRPHKQFEHTDKCKTYAESQTDDAYWALWSKAYVGKFKGVPVYLRACPLFELMKYLIGTVFDEKYSRSSFEFYLTVDGLPEIPMDMIRTRSNRPDDDEPVLPKQQNVKVVWQWQGKREYEQWQRELEEYKEKQAVVAGKDVYVRYVGATPFNLQAVQFLFANIDVKIWPKKDRVTKNFFIDYKQMRTQLTVEKEEFLQAALKNLFTFFINHLLFPFIQTGVLDDVKKKIEEASNGSINPGRLLIDREISAPLRSGLYRDEVYETWRRVTYQYNTDQLTVDELRAKYQREYDEALAKRRASRQYVMAPTLNDNGNGLQAKTLFFSRLRDY